MSQIYHYMQRSANIMLAQARGLDRVPLAERAEEMVKKGLTLSLSTYNRYLASEVAAKYDGWVSTNGAITEGFAGDLEHVLYTQFGITTKNRESLYEAMDDYREQRLTNPLVKEDALKGLANDYYANLIFRAVKLNDEAPAQETYDLLMDEWLREQALLFSHLDADDAERVSTLVKERVRKAMESPDSAEKVFLERLTNGIRENRFGNEGPYIGAYLNRVEALKNNPALRDRIYNSVIHATENSLENE